MRLNEFDTSQSEIEQMSALAQFLLARADDENSSKKISVPAFISLANDMGISLTKDQLLNLVSKPPLNNLIDNVEGDEILFKGNAQADSTMSMTKAQDVVGKMSKRALGKRD